MTFLWASGASDIEHLYALGLDVAHWVGCTSAEDEAPVAAYLALRMGAPAPEISDRAADAAVVAVRVGRLSEPGQENWLRSRIGICKP